MPAPVSIKVRTEAEILLEAWKSYKGDALLVIIPRHPERFQTTFSLDAGYRVQYRGDNLPVDQETQMDRRQHGRTVCLLFGCQILPSLAAALWTGCRMLSNRFPTMRQHIRLFNPQFLRCMPRCHPCGGGRAQVGTAERWYEKTTSWLTNPSEKERFSQKALEFISKHQRTKQTHGGSNRQSSYTSLSRLSL